MARVMHSSDSVSNDTSPAIVQAQIGSMFHGIGSEEVRRLSSDSDLRSPFAERLDSSNQANQANTRQL